MMLSSCLRPLAVVLAGVVLAASASAPYPIPPVPLRELIEEADLIAIATVREVRHVGDEESMDFDELWYSDLAKLEIKAVLAGDLVEEVDVYYCCSLACPAPPRYVPGETSLVFLYENEDRPGWGTCSLSYGQKKVTGSGMRDAYVARIREMQAIAKVKDPEERHKETLDWLVECAVHPATRWEGTYELVGHEHTVGFVDRYRPPNELARHLTAEHQERLLRAFHETGSYDDSGSLLLVALVAPWGDPKVIERLTMELKELHAKALEMPIPVCDEPGCQHECGTFDCERAAQQGSHYPLAIALNLAEALKWEDGKRLVAAADWRGGTPWREALTQYLHALEEQD
jgi:hypothetical protein